MHENVVGNQAPNNQEEQLELFEHAVHIEIVNVLLSGSLQSVANKGQRDYLQHEIQKCNVKLRLDVNIFKAHFIVCFSDYFFYLFFLIRTQREISSEVYQATDDDDDVEDCCH